MAEELKKVECDPTCGFMVRTHDEKELVEIVKRLARATRPMP